MDELSEKLEEADGISSAQVRVYVTWGIFFSFGFLEISDDIREQIHITTTCLKGRNVYLSDLCCFSCVRQPA